MISRKTIIALLVVNLAIAGYTLYQVNEMNTIITAAAVAADEFEKQLQELPEQGQQVEQQFEEPKIDDNYVKGDENAKVIVFEFSEYQCPFCGRFYTQTYKELIEKYVDTGKVKWVFKHFPLGFHPYAQKAAEANECAGEQDKFWEYHDYAFEHQEDLNEENLKAWAKELELDEKKFNDCLDDGKYEEKVKKDLAEAQAVGATGTPTFFINNKKLVGARPTQDFIDAIEEALAS